MKIKMKFITIFLLICYGKFVTSFVLSTMNDVNTVLTFIDFAQRGLEEGEKREKIDDVIDKVVEVAEQLDDIAKSINDKLDAISKAIVAQETTRKLTDAKDKLSDYINRIDELYEEFLSYSDDTSSFQQKTIKKFVDELTSHDDGALMNTLNRMHALFVPKRAAAVSESILDLVLEQQKLGDACERKLSIQQQLLELYELVVISELKGYAITNFAYYSLSFFDKAPYTKEREKSLGQAVKRSIEYLTDTKAAMEKASRKFKRCDPKKWRKDTDYIELDHLYQGYLIGEDQTWSSCGNSDRLDWRKCHWWAKSHKEATFFMGTPSSITVWREHDICLHHKCHGHVHRCTWVGTPTVCELKDDPLRRYSWVTGDGDTTWGEKKGCQGDQRFVETQRKGGHNNMCLCECAEENQESKAVRGVSLLPSLSDVKNNMVVVGVRLTKDDNMIQLQIEESKLLEGGEVDKNTTKWVKSHKYEYKEEGGSGEWDYVEKDGKKRRLENKKDYSWLWAYQKSLNIDNVFAPKNYVITGVKFVHDDSKTPAVEGTRWQRNPVQLSIHITKFDYKTGKLNADDHKWVTPQNMENPPSDYSKERSEVALDEATDPLKNKGENKDDSHPNQIIKFGMSDLKKDVGAYTIPYIDIQPVSPISKAALDGIGDFHKGAYGYGGFFALQVFHLDYSKYIVAGLTPENEKKYRKPIDQADKS